MAEQSPLQNAGLLIVHDDERLKAFLDRYGEIMKAKEVAELFRYKSDRAFVRAAERGSLPVRVFQVPGRRGRFVETRSVAAWMTRVLQRPSPRR